MCEQACVDRFMRDTCGCKTRPRQSPCSTCSLLSKEQLKSVGKELSRDELDLVVIGQIRAHRTTRSVASSTAPSSSRQRSLSMEYQFYQT